LNLIQIKESLEMHGLAVYSSDWIVTITTFFIYSVEISVVARKISNPRNRPKFKEFWRQNHGL